MNLFLRSEKHVRPFILATCLCWIGLKTYELFKGEASLVEWCVAALFIGASFLLWFQDDSAEGER